MPLAPSQIPPETGWSCKEVRDAAIFDVHCQLCRQPLRWVLVLTHADWPSELQVGCECAQHRCHPDFDVVGAQVSAMKRDERLRRFCNPERWHLSDSRNLVRKVGKARVTLFEKYGAWRYTIKPWRKSAIFSPETYSTLEAAAIAAFDHCDSILPRRRQNAKV